MITIEPFFAAEAGQATDPVLRGVTRGLAQVMTPIETQVLPDDLAELVRRLEERVGSRQE
jgi:hypothetical protein